jgi:hypothetical protein
MGANGFRSVAHAHKDTHKRQPVTSEPARGAPGGVADLRTQNCRMSKPGGGGFYIDL